MDSVLKNNRQQTKMTVWPFQFSKAQWKMRENRERSMCVWLTQIMYLPRLFPEFNFCSWGKLKISHFYFLCLELFCLYNTCLLIEELKYFHWNCIYNIGYHQLSMNSVSFLNQILLLLLQKGFLQNIVNDDRARDKG